MTAIVLERARTLREYRLDTPAVEYGHVLIRVEYACVLDDDLDAFYYGYGKVPRVFGSAMVGTVVAGPKAGRIVPFRGSGAGGALGAGTRVMGFFDDTQDGALRDYAVVPEDRCHVLPPDIREDRVPLIPDAARAAGIVRRLGIAPGQTLVVLGARATGVVLSLIAQAAGATVVLVDPSRSRLNGAEELGVHHTINPIAASLPEELDWFIGGRVDFVVDTSGDPEFMPAAVASLHRGSVLGLTGPMDYPFNLSEIAETGICIQGLTETEPAGAAAVDLARDLPLERLVSRSVPFVEIPAVVPVVMRERGAFLRLVGYAP
ncbi:MAG: zinc-binding dehydrogenase [Alkalispirochaeta sp.]